MMQTVTVKNITLGEGIPKICVSLVGKDKEAYITEIAAIRKSAADVVEWRMDWFDEVENIETLLDILQFLHHELYEYPILATFRSTKEGGEKILSDERYVAINEAVCRSGLVDMIDVELFRGEAVVTRLIKTAHANDRKVIMSNHDFHQTPSYDQILTRLKAMQNFGADIAKIAVMPTCKNDVLTLLAATSDMIDQYATCPIITMAMSGTGVITRLCGELFGSCLTFGAAKKASAPGQIPVDDLKQVLDILHANQ